jgi:Domain of unknown function (DUF4159)
MFSGRRRLVVLVASVLVVALAAAASAQFGRQRRRGGGGGFGGYGFREGSIPPVFPPVAHFSDGAFTFCKLMYTQVRYEDMGVGWATDYPYAGINLSTRLGELTKTPISHDEDGNPFRWVVRATDDALFDCPFVAASDVGTLAFSPEERARLREYLLKGGFLWVDDFWGTPAWRAWSSEIGQVLPEYPIEDVPLDHPLLHTLYDVTKIPQITNIQFWRSSGGLVTSERGSDSPYAELKMIANEQGRIMVLMTHNTDVGDSWEREAEDHEFFLQFSPDGYALGVDALLYAMTH